jgi:ketosteroid isomerase-like protein
VTLATVDRLDILELLARADNAATRRDIPAYVSLFTDDAVLDGEKGEHRGRQALSETVGSVWTAEGPSSVHVTLNAVIDDVPDRSEQATATSALLIIAPGPPPTLRSISTIVQHLEKTATGWRIARRTIASP